MSSIEQEEKSTPDIRALREALEYVRNNKAYNVGNDALKNVLNERAQLLADLKVKQEEVEKLRKVVLPLVTRLEKMMENGPDGDCSPEGHMCGWPDLNREVDAAQKALNPISEHGKLVNE